MKKITFLLAFVLCLLLCTSCDASRPEVKLTNDVPLYIIKFCSSNDASKVIASHAITDWTHNNFDESADDYNYVFDTTCYKFIYEPGVTDEEYNQMRSIAGTIPYIELSDGYWLIDWRWQDYLPVSYRYLFLNTRKIKFNSQNHFFFMNTSWEDVTSLSQTWQSADIYQPFGVKEWRAISCQSLERYMKGIKSPLEGYISDLDNKYEYVGLNSGFDETAYWKYRHGGIDEYAKFASVADSLYSVYVKGLNNLIATKELKKWTYEIPH